MSFGVTQKMAAIFLLCALVLCLGACSTFSFKPAEEVLESRVRGLMDARVNMLWSKAYEFYAPSYKENNPKDAFMSKNRQSNVVRYEIESIEIGPSGDEATVKVKNDMSAMSFEFPGVVMTQKWVKVGWRWYLNVNEETTQSLP